MSSSADSPRPDKSAIVRAAAEAAANRDVDALIALCHPEIEWTPFMADLEGKTYCGHAGIHRLMEDVYGYLGPFSGSFEEFEEQPDGRVLVIGRFHGEGPASGVPVDRRFAQVWTMKDGRAVRVRTYPDASAARAELGARL
jgi:ketosteroid isomerase-like protein